MKPTLTRREMLAGAGAAGAIGLVTAAPPARAARKGRGPGGFRYSLNTSTIRGQGLPITEEVEIAAKAGYDAIEPWIGELDTYVKGGGSLADLGKRIKDRGLTVESAIGFPAWIVDDPTERAKGLEEARRSMDMLQQIGGTRLAAPPVGAVDRSDISALKIAERYRALLEVGERMGVTPQVEVWGFSQTLNRLGSAALVAIESDHPKACVLADVYHLYKGGSNFEGLKLLSGTAMHVFHVNDYPASLAPQQIKDADRVYPGDGDAPLTEIFQDLRRAGFQGVLSLELFNPTYWKQDPLLVAKTGLKKTHAAVRKALG